VSFIIFRLSIFQSLHRDAASADNAAAGNTARVSLVELQLTFISLLLSANTLTKYLFN